MHDPCDPRVRIYTVPIFPPPHGVRDDFPPGQYVLYSDYLRAAGDHPTARRTAWQSILSALKTVFHDDAPPPVIHDPQEARWLLHTFNDACMSGPSQDWDERFDFWISQDGLMTRSQRHP